MQSFRLQDILELQKKLESIRNVCILAHVDHGKTTLADSLIAYNRLINQKLSGSLRYLDYREDEQTRGITMKSCSISIIFERVEDNSEDENEKDCAERKDTRHYVINLIDSPGHLDFSGEFSAASKISDGALILIDVVEGMCTQTVQAIKEAYQEKMAPILVLNKIDRLITDLKLDTLDAYKHICQMIEEVNALMATFHNESSPEVGVFVLYDDTCTNKTNNQQSEQVSASLEIIDRDDSTRNCPVVLHPGEGNVIFASAIDQWGFRFYSKKYGFSQKTISKTLWGDYYLDSKTKTIKSLKHSNNKNQKPMFVELVLDNIWLIYNTFIENKDRGKIEKMIKTLNIKVSPYDIKSKDRRKVLRTFMGQWMPLAPSIMKALVKHVPSPKALTEERINFSFDIFKQTPEYIVEGLRTCSKSSNAVLVFCPKIFLVKESMINSCITSGEAPEQMERRRLANIAKRNQLISGKLEKLNNKKSFGQEDLSDSSDTSSVGEVNYMTIGFARIYSGTLRLGDTLHVYGPSYMINTPDKHTYSFEVESLYTLMGREFIEINDICAGNIFGIRFPSKHNFKTCIVSSYSPGYVKSNYVRPTPIVRVAIEPQDPTQMQRLINGLKRLNQSDSSVEIHFSDTGEHIIAAAGELHLERCLDDLKEHFAKIPIHCSSPIVPFRETIANVNGVSNFSNECFQLYFQRYLKNSSNPSPNYPNSDFNTVTLTTSDQLCSITIQSWKIPESVSNLLCSKGTLNMSSYEKSKDTTEVLMNKLIECGTAIDKDDPRSPILWGEALKRIIKMGPGNSRENILVDFTGNSEPCKNTKPAACSPSFNRNRKELCNLGPFLESICSGFYLAVSRGPLCEEQVTGLCFVVKEFYVNAEIDNSTVSSLIGKVITTMRDACIRSMISWSLRICLAMYSCDLIAPGKVHAVLGKRGGTIYSEQIKEGTSFFEVKFKLPVINSFGFAQEMRKRTSGAADPQMHFCGFEPLDIDPFWVPTTEDELEDLGEKSDRDNLSKKITDSVRKRKGLLVDEMIFKHAEKQKNIKNK